MPQSPTLQKYPHQVQTVKVLGMEYKLLVPTDPDEIFFAMDAADFGAQEKLPHWARLWPGAFALGEYLLQSGIKPQARVLDLGCGLALNGIIAAQLGAEVLASDWFEEALDFAQANADLNGVKIQTAWMDWNQPPADLQVDLLLGADLLYERRNHEPLLACIRKVVAPGGKVWLSDHGRPHLPDWRALLKAEKWPYEELMVGGIHVFVLEIP